MQYWLLTRTCAVPAVLEGPAEPAKQGQGAGGSLWGGLDPLLVIA